MLSNLYRSKENTPHTRWGIWLFDKLSFESEPEGSLRVEDRVIQLAKYETRLVYP